MFHSPAIMTSRYRKSGFLGGKVYPALCILLLLIGLASPLSSGAERVPTALNTAGEAGERVYDAARLDDWANASGQVRILRIATRDLLENINDDSMVEYRELESAVTELEKEVSTHARIAAMSDANEVTHVIANLKTTFQPRIPASIDMLDYYGRRLQIGISQGDLPALREACAGIERTWISIRPSVTAKGGTQQAKRFDRIVERLLRAQRIAAFIPLAKAEQDAVDELEHVFER